MPWTPGVCERCILHYSDYQAVVPLSIILFYQISKWMKPASQELSYLAPGDFYWSENLLTVCNSLNPASTYAYYKVQNSETYDWHDIPIGVKGCFLFKLWLIQRIRYSRPAVNKFAAPKSIIYKDSYLLGWNQDQNKRHPTVFFYQNICLLELAASFRFLSIV